VALIEDKDKSVVRAILLGAYAAAGTAAGLAGKAARHHRRLLGGAMVPLAAGAMSTLAGASWPETQRAPTVVANAAARQRLAGWGIQVMTISVITGNEGALRFYHREGVSNYQHTLIMPVKQPPQPSSRTIKPAMVTHAPASQPITRRADQPRRKERHVNVYGHRGPVGTGQRTDCTCRYCFCKSTWLPMIALRRWSSAQYSGSR